MKIISILLLLFCSYTMHAQAVFADPSLGQVFFVNNDGSPVDMPPVLSREKIYILKVPVYNLNTGNMIQPGATKIKIGLGSKMVLDPAFNLSNTNTSAYFNWTAENVGGQMQLTGDQIAPLPQGFSDTALFSVKGIILGVSTITVNFLVTNHNTGGLNLSDENGANNISSQAYFIMETVPVDFTGIQVRNEECTVAVTFSTANEYNLRHFIIEYSPDGLNFTTTGQVLPRGNGQYQYRFNVPANITANIIHVRVRSVDIDGRMQYSEIKTLRDLCKGLSATTLYPNPVRQDQNHITILRNTGVFNGSYVITIFDVYGRKINTARLQLANTRQFDYSVNRLAAGNYTIKIEATGEETVALKFQKMN